MKFICKAYHIIFENKNEFKSLEWHFVKSKNLIFIISWLDVVSWCQLSEKCMFYGWDYLNVWKLSLNLDMTEVYKMDLAWNKPNNDRLQNNTFLLVSFIADPLIIPFWCIMG